MTVSEADVFCKTSQLIQPSRVTRVGLKKSSYVSIGGLCIFCVVKLVIVRRIVLHSASERWQGGMEKTGKQAHGRIAPASSELSKHFLVERWYGMIVRRKMKCWSWMRVQGCMPRFFQYYINSACEWSQDLVHRRGSRASIFMETGIFAQPCYIMSHLRSS